MRLIAVIFTLFTILYYNQSNASISDWISNVISPKCSWGLAEVKDSKKAKDIDAFFHPTIKVCASNPNCDSCKEMPLYDCECFIPGGCVRTYLNSNQNTQKLEICACSGFACGDISMGLGSVKLSCNKPIGCKELPIEPGPPPFCGIIGAATPQVRFVPVDFHNQSFLDPKIKVIVGSDKDKVENILTVPINDSQKSFTIPFNGEQYKIVTSHENAFNNACGSFYENIYDTSPLITQCLPIPEVTKPAVSSNGNTLTLKFPNCSNANCIMTLNEGTDKNTGITVFKPDIRDDHTLNYTEKCDHGIQKGHKCSDQNNKNSNIQIPTTVTYATNPNSNMLCVSGIKSQPEEYILKNPYRPNSKYTFKNKLYQWIRATGKGFVSYKVINNTDSNTNEYALDGDVLDPYSLRQSNFDTMKKFAGTYYTMNDNNSKTNNKIVYNYENMFKLNNNNQCKGFNISKNGIENTCATKYIDEDTGEYVFLPDDKISDLEPRDPYLSGLCDGGFRSTEFNTPGKDDIYKVNAQECDFVKIEVWGGKSHKDSQEILGDYTMGVYQIPNIKTDSQNLKFKDGKENEIQSMENTLKIYKKFKDTKNISNDDEKTLIEELKKILNTIDSKTDHTNTIKNLTEEIKKRNPYTINAILTYSIKTFSTPILEPIQKLQDYVFKIHVGKNSSINTETESIVKVCTVKPKIEASNTKTKIDNCINEVINGKSSSLKSCLGSEIKNATNNVTKPPQEEYVNCKTLIISAAGSVPKSISSKDLLLSRYSQGTTKAKSYNKSQHIVSDYAKVKMTCEKWH